MAYSRNPTWVDGGPGVGTRIDAVDLENIENGLVAAATVADNALANAATAQTGANASVKKLNDLSDISNPTAALANLSGVPTSRTVTAGAGLTGGGDLTANRSLAVVADAGLPSQAGNSGKFLTTNGSVSSWAPVAASGPVGMAPRVGDWLTANDIKSFNANSNQTRSTGNGPFLLVAVPVAMTVDALACYVDTLEAASTIRLGLYSTDSNGFPTTLLGSVSVPGTATGQQSQTFGAPIVLTPGQYALVARVSSLTTLRLRGCVPAGHSAVGIGAMQISDTGWIVASFGTSASLNNVSTYANDLPDHTALVGMRRSA